jgi:putative component of membrane protein insertase Oxa1/YidC/SpoIIIJ protein YidD
MSQLNIKNGSCFYLLLLLLLFNGCKPAKAQNLKSDLNSLKRLFVQPQMQIEYSTLAQNLNPIKATPIYAIRFYQKFISSQDMETCSFHPSCSRFSGMAFQKTSFIKGLFLTSDRLQRCSGFPGIDKYYEFNTQYGKLNDPVENYISLEEKNKRTLFAP